MLVGTIYNMIRYLKSKAVEYTFVIVEYISSLFHFFATLFYIFVEFSVTISNIYNNDYDLDKNLIIEKDMIALS